MVDSIGAAMPSYFEHDTVKESVPQVCSIFHTIA